MFVFFLATIPHPYLTFQWVPEKSFPRWPGREADNARLAIPSLPHTSTWCGVYDRTALRFTLTARDKNMLCLGFWTNCINGTHNAKIMSESRRIVCVKLMHGVDETSCRGFTPKSCPMMFQSVNCPLQAVRRTEVSFGRRRSSRRYGAWGCITLSTEVDHVVLSKARLIQSTSL
jgi:hypothetical protein